MIIKCKMCGGDIRFNPGDTYGTCEYCGSTCTIPEADDEQKLNRYNRANHFRRQCEFDKAVSAYEKILETDDTDAEAHWGVVLSRFGIEYVEDPVTKRRVPTCHRVQVSSILADEDYQAALKYAPDAESRKLYQGQAEEIAEIQKGILAISAEEKPYDVFICYKESDETGQRTKDSTLAQDIYYQLTEQGYKVFFSRITLEDKLGQQYEPYIFAALNSAKVMLVIGTKPEYFNAVWVKNEWSRYLALMKNDRKRILIPCYRDMDPYDLPEELSSLQSQDMGKIGFIQDLLRGVQKVLDADKKEEAPKVIERVVERSGEGGAAPGIESLMKRAYLFMEDGDFDNADEYLNRVLDIAPNYAPAYAARTCTALKFRREQDLGEATFLYSSNADWQKALRFASPEQKKVYEAYQEKTKVRVERQMRQIQEEDYQDALKTMQSAGTESIKWSRDGGVISKLNNQNLDGYKDIDALRAEAKAKCKQYQESEAKIAQARLKRNAIIAAAAVVIAVSGFFFNKNLKYNHAQTLLAEGNYAGAYKEFSKVKGFKDVNTILTQNENLVKVQEERDAMFAVGQTVTFGTYEQDNDTSNGKEKIKWIVLARNGEQALLLSKQGLDAQPYNKEDIDITWKKSTIRSWLNSTFLNAAFTKDEQTTIRDTNVDNSQSKWNIKWETTGGDNTQDKVFLLSYGEVIEYFNSTSARICEPTAYAVAQGVHQDDTGNCWWWLRSLAKDQDYDYAALVNEDGSLGYDPFNDDRRAVRPALWVNLDSDVF